MKMFVQLGKKLLLRAYNSHKYDYIDKIDSVFIVKREKIFLFKTKKHRRKNSRVNFDIEQYNKKNCICSFFDELFLKENVVVAIFYSWKANTFSLVNMENKNVVLEIVPSKEIYYRLVDIYVWMNILLLHSTILLTIYLAELFFFLNKS